MDCDEVRLIHQKFVCQTFQQRPFYPEWNKCMTILTMNCYLLEGKLAHNKASAKIFYLKTHIFIQNSQKRINHIRLNKHESHITQWLKQLKRKAMFKMFYFSIKIFLCDSASNIHLVNNESFKLKRKHHLFHQECVGAFVMIINQVDSLK